MTQEDDKVGMQLRYGFVLNDKRGVSFKNSFIWLSVFLIVTFQGKVRFFVCQGENLAEKIRGFERACSMYQCTIVGGGLFICTRGLLVGVSGKQTL